MSYFSWVIDSGELNISSANSKSSAEIQLFEFLA